MWYNVYQRDIVKTYDTYAEADAAPQQLQYEDTSSGVEVTVFAELIGTFSDITYRELKLERERYFQLAIESKGDKIESYWWTVWSKFWHANKPTW